MSIEAKKEKQAQQQLFLISNDKFFNQQSPVFPSSRLNLDREIIRSVTFFGETESINDIAKRVTSFNHLDSKEKRAA